MINQLKIECFLAAAEHMSVTVASERLFVSRQAVSKQIHQLEADLGVQLFQREPGRLSLTEAGLEYYRFFARTAQEAKALERRFRGSQSLKQPLRIGYPKNVEIHTELMALTGQLPQLQIQWSCLEPELLAAQFRSGKLDMIFNYESQTTQLMAPQEYDSTLFLNSRTVVVISNNHPRAAEIQSCEDLRNETFCIWKNSSEASEEEAQRKLSEGLRRFGLRAKRILILPNQDSAETTVEMGGGLGLCSELNRLAKSANVKTIPIGVTSNLLCLWKPEESREDLLQLIKLIQERSSQNSPL